MMDLIANYTYSFVAGTMIAGIGMFLVFMGAVILSGGKDDE